MKRNDIARVRLLDYESAEHPSDPKELEEWNAMVSTLKSMEGKAVLVLSSETVDDETYCTVKDLSDTKLKSGDREHPLAFKESELELLETDWINNCCMDKLGERLDTSSLCSSCGMGVGVVLASCETKTEPETKP